MKQVISWILILLLVAGCAQPRPTLTEGQAKHCHAQGGYESSGGFGEPICQASYPDAGKTCSGKTDCEARCLFSEGQNMREWIVGMHAVGKCEAQRQTFGCYAEVENGKLSTGGSCVD
jgi:hypothetical protein